VLAWEGEKQLRGVQPLPPRQGEKQVCGVQWVSSRQAERQLLGVQSLPPRQAEKQLRGVQPLPSRQDETPLRGVHPLPSRQAQKELRELQERLETLLRGRPTGLEETHGMKQAERVVNTLGVTCALEFMYSITIHQTRTSRNSGECESSVAMRSIQSKSPLPGSLRVLR